MIVGRGVKTFAHRLAYVTKMLLFGLKSRSYVLKIYILKIQSYILKYIIVLCYSLTQRKHVLSWMQKFAPPMLLLCNKKEQNKNLKQLGKSVY